MKGEYVKMAIKAFGRTQAEVAAAISIEREHLNRLLNDPNTEFPEEYLIKIRNLGIKPEDVIKSDNSDMVGIIQKLLVRVDKDMDSRDKDVELFERSLIEHIESNKYFREENTDFRKFILDIFGAALDRSKLKSVLSNLTSK